jgi:hypothetical protein
VELTFEKKFHFALRFMLLQWFFIIVLILYAPVVDVLRFFSPGAPVVLLIEGYAGYITPCRIFAVVPISPFISSVRGMEFLFFEGGTGVLL